MKTYDVVLIGFGPVGQMLSAQFGQAGHSVAAFEAYETLYGLSRTRVDRSYPARTPT